MAERYRFFESILDSLTENIVVIDGDGTITFANQNWVTFGRENDKPQSSGWVGLNYLQVCDQAGRMGDQSGITAARGIRQVIDGDDFFSFEYDCHSPDEPRWFIMRVTRFHWNGEAYYVVTHQDITKRKLAEQEVLKLARIDGLTNVANRRFMDEFINEEWRRCARLGLPFSFAIIDIDHFKLFNDAYGHLEGDDCLVRVGQALKKFARRPSDLCARYGGEEFALVLGNTPAEDARAMMQQVLEDIRELNIPHEASPSAPIVTVSIGLATCVPTLPDHENRLLETADKKLYQAKSEGRDQIAANASD
ncbi:diguanylate cyclase [Marinobacteraceae bacterium S3BR75-40.1]